MKSFLQKLLKKRGLNFEKEFEICLRGNSKGLNILIFSENINATYYISFDMPLRQMHARGEVNFAVVSQGFVAQNREGCWENWGELFKPDIVIFTRYGEPFGSSILDYFKSEGVPIIYHIDDNLLEIPSSLGVEIQQRQGALSVVNTRKYLMQHADLIYASTPYLATLLKGKFPNQEVVDGIYAPYMCNVMEAGKEKSDSVIQIIGYMGSKGHQHDLEMICPAIEKLLLERPSLIFETFGTIKMPDRLKSFGSRVKSRKVQKSYKDFLITLGSLGWDIGLAPLVDEPFNRCKAPTKYIEYTACGIPVIASNISVYSEIIPTGGGVLVNNDWSGSILKLLDSTNLRLEMLKVSREYCKVTYALSVLEKQLQNIFSIVLQDDSFFYKK